jgi:hypothetical protein
VKEERRLQISRLAPWLYLAVLAAVNLYICRDALVSTSCHHWNAMHGQWMALARLARFSWLHPTWWRYWGGGEPLSSTYNPLIPFGIAAISASLHCSLALALSLLTVSVYCLGPLSFYLLSWRLSRRPGLSFVAALTWSLLSPAGLVMPDPGFGWQSMWSPRRLRLAFEWDDLPHLTGLAFMPLAVWGMACALERRRPLDYAVTGLALAGMMLANMFGGVLAAFVAITVPLALESRFRPMLLLRAALIAALTYAVVSPWLPPSLLITMRANASRDGESGQPLQAAIALMVVAIAAYLVWRWSARRIAGWAARWMLLFGTLVILIPALAQYAGWHFLPQPHRYKMEAELAIVWIAVFGLAPAVERIPRAARIVLLVLVLVLAGRQMLAFARIAKELVTAADVERSIEYRSSKWVAENLPGERVMMAGSMGNFMNDFNAMEQLSAEPYTTGPNWAELIAIYTLYTDTNAGDRAADYSLLWLKAFGVQAIAVPGPRSPEYWKPFTHPRKFDGVLPVLWREDDTTIYRVPQASPSLVHPLRPNQLVRHPPAHGLDTGELDAFMAALDSSPRAGSIEWQDANHARIRAHIEPGELLSTQITYNPGWHVHVNGASRTIRADGIGLMAIDARCTGDCVVELEFDGGREWRWCLAASGVTLLLLAAGWMHTLVRRGQKSALPAVTPD